MKVGSLFSGGGLGDLGFLMAGCEIVFQVEIDEYCQKILNLRYPDAKKFRDIRTVKGIDLPECDIITGGFPCQDISINGRGAGLKGERSGLWREYLRIIREVRPKYLVVENVTALLFRGMGDVLRSLAKERYDAEWRVFSARELGLPHQRERVFIVAYNGKVGGGALFKKKVQRLKIFQRYENVRRVEDFFRLPDTPKPLIRGNNDGVANVMDRLSMLGNGQVPYCTKWIAERIMEFERVR